MFYSVFREAALAHAWNPADCSFNLSMKPGDAFTVRRRPVAQSTDCVRGQVKIRDVLLVNPPPDPPPQTGYRRGLHIFEVTWPATERGTHAVVGVANRQAPLHCVGYRSLVGDSPHSWGWDLGRRRAFHGKQVRAA